MATILTKKSDTASAVPLAGDLTNSTGGAELAVNTADKRLFVKNSGGTVVELGTNPTILNVDNIQINGNAITSTDTNGNIDLTPNGTGEVNITKVDIDSGTIDGTTIGASSPSTGAFTTLSSTGNTTLGDASGDTLTINGNAVSTPNGLNFDSNTLVIDAANNVVGIGTSTPACKLHINETLTSGTDINITRFSTTSGGVVNLVCSDLSSATPLWTLQTGTSENLAFKQGTSELMRLTSTGLGIGTTSPLARLHVQGNAVSVSGTGRAVAFVDDSTSYAAGVGGAINFRGKYNAAGDYVSAAFIQASKTNSTDGNDAFDLLFGTRPNGDSTTERMRIDSSGRVAINVSGNAYSQDAGFTVNGTGFTRAIYTNINGTALSTHCSFANGNGVVGSITTNGSATAFNTSSDYRLKENIAPMTGALDKVAALKPCTYTWKADGSAGEGFIAHELAEVVPQCVTGEKDAVDADGNPQYQGVDTSFLVATLTAAIQELKSELDSVKAELATLKG
jgi:hypothetical protein